MMNSMISKIRLPAVCLAIILIGTFLILFTPLVISRPFFFPFVVPKTIYFFGLVQLIFFTWLIFLISRAQPKSGEEGKPQREQTSSLLTKKPQLNLNPLFLALTLFIGVLILSSIFGLDFWKSFWGEHERMGGFLTWIHLFLFFIVISSVFKSQNDWLVIFSISILIASFVSLLGLLSMAGYHPISLLAASLAGSTLGNSSFLGTYLLFNFFLALYLFFISKENLSRASSLFSAKNFKIYSAVCFIIITLGLIFSGAWAAVLSVGGGLILFYLLSLLFSKKRKIKLAGIFLLIIFTGLIFTFIYFSFAPDTLLGEKIYERFSKSRLVIWQSAWQMFLERPWLGWGLENYELAHFKYFDPRLFLPEYGGETIFDRAHNIVFDTLVANGIFGLIFYLGIFFTAFYVLFKKFLLQRIDFFTFRIFLVILISYFVQNLTVFDMTSSYLMFFLILGFIASISGQQNFKQDPSPYWQPIARGNLSFFNKLLCFIVLLVFCLSFFKFVFQPLLGSSYIFMALNSPIPRERIFFYQKSLETTPIGKHQVRRIFADGAMESVFRREIEKFPIEDFKLEFDFLGQELEKNIKEIPLDFSTYLQLARFYMVYNQVDPAKELPIQSLLEKAIELSPNNPRAYWALVQTHFVLGNFDKALSLAEKAIQLEPRIKQSHLLIIQLAISMKDYELAEKKFQEAIKINPDWEEEFKEILIAPPPNID